MTASAPKRAPGPSNAGPGNPGPERFKLVNLDRHEYLDPGRLGWEASNSRAGRRRLLDALALLIALGDDHEPEGVRGRWSGDRIVLVGNRSDPGLYRWVTEGKNMHEVSALLQAALPAPKSD
jgi:hypothetical protein